MFFRKNSFENKSLKNRAIKRKKRFNIKNLFIYLLVSSILFLWIYFWNNISYAFWNYIKNIAWDVIKIVIKASAKEPKKDSLWNVNILLLWIWWKNHDWWYLTDTIMVASFNKRLNTLTFLSIPRDLYVKYDKYIWWRINYIFAKEYLRSHSYKKAAYKLEEKIREIIGMKINYYAVIDFWWFEKIVDNLWWLTINVPYTIKDTKYPWPNRTYITFKIEKWIHHINWATALKYVRSRHSTSDFSRSKRQEQIIKAIIKKLTSSWILLSPTKIRKLYLQFQDMLHTNMDFETMLSFVPYIKELKIHSYVLNWDCFMQKVTWKNLTPWCFVYPASRDAFNWQAVLLPVWATQKKVDDYSKIRKFAFITIWYPELWLENAKIQILNGIKKRSIKKYYWYTKHLASELAYKLKNYWFNIKDVGNASKLFTWNTDYIYNKKTITEQLISAFIPDIMFKTWDIKYAWSWFDMTLIIWENYLYNQKK